MFHIGNHPKNKYTPRGELEHSRAAHHEGEDPQKCALHAHKNAKTLNTCPCLCLYLCSCHCPCLCPNQMAVDQVLANGRCQDHGSPKLALLYLCSCLSSYHGLSGAGSTADRRFRILLSTKGHDRTTKVVPSNLTILVADPDNLATPTDDTGQHGQLPTNDDLHPRKPQCRRECPSGHLLVPR